MPDAHRERDCRDQRQRDRSRDQRREHPGVLAPDVLIKLERRPLDRRRNIGRDDVVKIVAHGVPFAGERSASFLFVHGA